MLTDLLLRKVDALPTFTVLQIGAFSPDGSDDQESYMDFPDRFRGSRVIVCEPDEALCDRMNKERLQEEGPEYYPVALGEPGQVCDFYLTESPEWNSLYRTDQNILFKYQNMNAALPTSATKLSTQGLDPFLKDIGVNHVDYIKINLPWIGLPLLQAGGVALKQALSLKVGTALVPLYEKQELFGDICASLVSSGFIFHRFSELYGRTFNPVVLSEDPNYATNHLWADALFLRDIGHIKQLGAEQLLKLAVLSDQFDSRDVAMLCLMEYDVRHGTSYGQIYGGMEEEEGRE